MTTLFKSAGYPDLVRDYPLRRNRSCPNFENEDTNNRPYKKSKIEPIRTDISKRTYKCTPILDTANRLECLVTPLTLSQINAKGEFPPDIESVVQKVKALNFDTLEGGPVYLEEQLSCKLFFLESQKIVLIKAPTKVIEENNIIKKVRPLEDLEGNQRKLRPIIGISRCGKMLNLLQLSTNVVPQAKFTAQSIKKTIDIEESIYSRFPKDHDRSPFPVTVCLLKEEGAVSEFSPIKRFKLLQKRESMSLQQLIANNIPLDFQMALSIACDLVRAVLVCHRNIKIVINDIKTDNILLDLINGRGRITDFGLVLFITDESEIRLGELFKGTPFMYPPELLWDYYQNNKSVADLNKVQKLDKDRTSARDIWALGIVLSLLLFRMDPSCIYRTYDHLMLQNMIKKILNRKATFQEIEMFFSRFQKEPFSEGQKNAILAIDDIYKEKRVEAMRIITKMLSVNPLERPLDQSLLDGFTQLMAPPVTTQDTQLITPTVANQNLPLDSAIPDKI